MKVFLEITIDGNFIQAFGADVEWILHNCIVYNGVGKLSLIAKQMVKTAEFEVSKV